MVGGRPAVDSRDVTGVQPGGGGAAPFRARTTRLPVQSGQSARARVVPCTYVRASLFYCHCYYCYYHFLYYYPPCARRARGMSRIRFVRGRNDNTVACPGEYVTIMRYCNIVSSSSSLSERSAYPPRSRRSIMYLPGQRVSGTRATRRSEDALFSSVFSAVTILSHSMCRLRLVVKR